MRAIVALAVLAAACGGTQQANSGASTAAPTTPPVSPVPPGTTPPGTNPPPGNPPGDPTTPPGDTTPPPDAGPRTIAEVACAATPQVIWSRSFADSAMIDFRGIADAQGNLYWIEYARPALEGDPTPPATLVSADATGTDRYRTPFGAPPEDFVLSGTTLVVTNGPVVTGYDTATGAQSWTADLSQFMSFDTGKSALSGGLLDLGTGRIALALNDSTFGGIFLLDSATGVVAGQTVAALTPRFRMLRTDGNGHALFAANEDHFSSASGSTSLITADIYEMDGNGNFQWLELVQGFDGVPLWASGALPWIGIEGATAVTVGPHYQSVPASWIGAAATRDGVVLVDGGFFMAGPTGGLFPLKIDFVRDGAIASSGLFSEISTFNGASVYDFGGVDHATFVTQQFNAQAGLCHPSTAGVAYLGTVTDTSAQLCKLPFTGDSGIVAVVPSLGNLVIGRYVVNDESCNSKQIAPFVVEAYARP